MRRIITLVLCCCIAFSVLLTTAAFASAEEAENETELEEFNKLVDKNTFTVKAAHKLPEKGLYEDSVLGIYGVRVDACSDGMTDEDADKFLKENGYLEYTIIIYVYSENVEDDIALLKARPDIASITPRFPEYWSDTDINAIKPNYKHLGDTNGNGKPDVRDYILAKRAYFGTYDLGGYSDPRTQFADINGNGKLDPRDYLLIKRVYFGTYIVGEPASPDEA